MTYPPAHRPLSARPGPAIAIGLTAVLLVCVWPAQAVVLRQRVDAAGATLERELSPAQPAPGQTVEFVLRVRAPAATPPIWPAPADQPGLIAEPHRDLPPGRSDDGRTVHERRWSAIFVQSGPFQLGPVEIRWAAGPDTYETLSLPALDVPVRRVLLEQPEEPMVISTLAPVDVPPPATVTARAWLWLTVAAILLLAALLLWLALRARRTRISPAQRFEQELRALEAMAELDSATPPAVLRRLDSAWRAYAAAALGLPTQTRTSNEMLRLLNLPDRTPIGPEQSPLPPSLRDAILTLAPMADQVKFAGSAATRDELLRGLAAARSLLAAATGPGPVEKPA